MLQLVTNIINPEVILLSRHKNNPYSGFLRILVFLGVFSLQKE